MLLRLDGPIEKSARLSLAAEYDDFMVLDDFGGEPASAPPMALWMPSSIEPARLLLVPELEGQGLDKAIGLNVGECGGDCAETRHVYVSEQLAVVSNRNGGCIAGWGYEIELLVESECPCRSELEDDTGVGSMVDGEEVVGL